MKLINGLHVAILTARGWVTFGEPCNISVPQFFIGKERVWLGHLFQLSTNPGNSSECLLHACQIMLLKAPYFSSMTLLTMYNYALVFMFNNCLPSQTKQGPHLTQPQHVARCLAHVHESVHEWNAGNVLDTHYSLGHNVVFTRPSMWRVWTCREQWLNLREGRTEKEFLEFCFICSGTQKIPRQIYMCLWCGGGLKTGRREKRNLLY